MTIRVTITKAGVTDEYGRAMVIGTTYSVSDSFGVALIQQGRASDTDASLVSPGVNQGDAAEIQYVNAAAIAAPTAQMLASFSTEFVLDSAPYTRYRTNGVTLAPVAQFSADATGNVTGILAATGFSVSPPFPMRGKLWKGTRGRSVIAWPTTTGSLQNQAGTVAMSTDLPTETDNATNSIRLTGNAAQSMGQMTCLSSDYTPANGRMPTMGIWVKNSGTRALNFQVTCFNLAANRQITYQGCADPIGSWVFLTFAPAQAQVNTFIYGTDQIHFVRVIQYDAGSEGAWLTTESVLFGNIYADLSGRPRFCFTLDNGTVTDISPLPVTGTPLLSGRSCKDIIEYYGFKGTTYIITSQIGLSGYMTATQILAMQSAGWTIGSHGRLHPANATDKGCRLLGPYGFAYSTNNASTITSTSGATANFSAAHNLNSGVVSPGMAIVFTDVAPTGLSLGTPYYINANSSATAVTLATDRALTIPINSTWSGTANFRIYGSANDDSAIYTELIGAVADLTAIGVTNAGRHYAISQGAMDSYVRSALIRSGIPFIRGISGNTGTNSYTLPLGVPSGGGNYSGAGGTTLFGGVVTQGDAIATDSATTLAQCQAYIDEVIRIGGTGFQYHHAMTISNSVLLDQVCQYVKLKSDAGLIDVMTADALYYDLIVSSAGPQPVWQEKIAPGVGIKLLGRLNSADMNVTADQAISIRANKYLVTGILVTNSAVSLTTAAGGVYNAASKGGTAIVAAAQTYAALTGTVTQSLLLTLAVTTTVQTATSLYFSLTTGQGAAATTDIYVFGYDLT